MVREIANAADVCCFGLPDATNIWQSVNGGFDELLKINLMWAYISWLDSGENAGQWYGVNHDLTAYQWIIIICLIGESYKDIWNVKHDKFRCQMFEKTKCLPEADSSGNHLVQIEGLPIYQVPSPTMIESTPHFAASSAHKGEIQDIDGKCQHDVESYKEENAVHVEEQIESDDWFEEWFVLFTFFIVFLFFVYVMFVYNFKCYVTFLFLP